MSSNKRLKSEFFQECCLELSKKLLGKKLCTKDKNGELLSGRIVETECYPGGTDKASHSFKGKTDRNQAMFMDPGTAYVYIIYGVLNSFNISAKEDGGAVLIRALEPVDGLDAMRINKAPDPAKKPPKRKAPMKDHELCNGPAKLCQSFKITKENANCMDMTKEDSKIWLEDDKNYEEDEIVVSTRIGIDSYGEEFAALPYRFYVKDCKSVSVKEVKKKKKDEKK